MNTTTSKGDWCERVAAAIADGRFLEDPGLYRPHVEACPECRSRVEGLFVLREHLGKASLEAPAGEAAPFDAKDVVGTAIRRYRRYRVVRDGTVGLVVLLGLGVGAFLWTRRSPPAEPDGIAYAKHLSETVFPKGRPPRTDLLGRDAALRGEYLKALDHPVSLVRRTALDALTMSEVTIDRARLESILLHAREDLETPIEVASSGDGLREIADALETRRVATLRSVLVAAGIQATTGAAVPSRLLAPLLSHPDVEVRRLSLIALNGDVSFRPGTEVERLAWDESDFELRAVACVCLLDHLGEQAATRIVAHLRRSPDPRFEERVLPHLGKFPSALLDLSKERLASETTPARLALAHARVLWRSGLKEPPPRLVERAIADPATDTVALFAQIAAEADWMQYRAALGERWQTAPRASRQVLAAALVLWDEQSQDVRRLQMALDICETDRDDALLKPALERMAKSAIPAVGARAREILASSSSPK